MFRAIVSGGRRTCGPASQHLFRPARGKLALFRTIVRAGTRGFFTTETQRPGRQRKPDKPRGPKDREAERNAKSRKKRRSRCPRPASLFWFIRFKRTFMTQACPPAGLTEAVQGSGVTCGPFPRPGRFGRPRCVRAKRRFRAGRRKRPALGGGGLGGWRAQPSQDFAEGVRWWAVLSLFRPRTTTRTEGEGA